MPNVKSAKKRVLVSATKTAQNKAAKTNLKTVLKKADAALANGQGKDAAVLAIKKVDQAAAKGLVHKNKAARIKSRLARKANAVG